MSNWRDKVTKFKYKESPIVEALCEFEFAGGDPLTRNNLLALASVFKREYPVQQLLPENKSLITIRIESKNSEGTPLGYSQFVSEDSTGMIQVGDNSLIINQLTPYPGWDSFKPKIARSLATFLKVAGKRSVIRSHLRYINKIELPGEKVEIDDWFEFNFRSPDIKNLRGTSSFLLGAMYESSKDSALRLEISNLPVREGTHPILLEREFISLGDVVMGRLKVEDWLERAHDWIERGWLGCITEKLHKKYQPEVVE